MIVNCFVCGRSLQNGLGTACVYAHWQETAFRSTSVGVCSFECKMEAEKYRSSRLARLAARQHLGQQA